MVVSAVVALGLGVRSISRGRKRSLSAAWSFAAMLPIVLFVAPLEYMRHQWLERRVPHSFLTSIGVTFAASLMDAYAAYRYPNRLESGHLVMYYRCLRTPRRDLEAMEQHVVNLEQMLGKPLRAKVHWVRGSLFGHGYVSFMGLALGSCQSPDDWNSSEGNDDRHELAHAVLRQYQPPDADPPMLLHEGWALTQSGADSLTLAGHALRLRQAGMAPSLKQLMGPRWYHQDSGPVYDIGGTFVDFLIRHYGVEAFVKLYNSCQPKTFDGCCLAVFGKDLDALEGLFWQDLQSMVTSQSLSPRKRGLSYAYEDN